MKTLQTILGALAPLFFARGEIMVDDDFDNGRIEVVSIDQANRIVTTRVPDDNHTQDGRMRFWHLRLTGLVPGERVTLRHTPSVDMHYVYSYDGDIWHRFPTRGVSDLSFRFVESSVFIAPNIAYPYSRSLALAAELAPNPHVTVSDLATSEQGRAVKLLRITDASVDDAGKRIVWIQGRQHGFESPSSLPPEGFARWMASDDPAAAAFRQQAIAYVVPIMDVDNVFHGMSGKDMPDDFNRSWQDEPAPWNAIQAAKDLLADLKSRGFSFLGFVDSHNPYYTQGPQWYVASSQANWDAFRARYLAAAAEAGGVNRHGMHIESFASGTPTNTERSRDYASFHLSGAPDFLALTLESPHHKDSDGAFMLEEGYLQWGEALGRAFHKHLGGTETPVNRPPKAASSHDGNGGFSAAGSSDPDGSIIAYHWDFGDGHSETTAGPDTSHVFDAEGDYAVSLRVEDDDGALSPRVSIHVPVGEAQPPFGWSAETQQGGSSWANSGWDAATFRLLLEGEHVSAHASKVSVTFRGRSSGSYSLRGVSLAKREADSLDVVDGSWTELTFGGGAWADGVTVPAGGWATSDPVEFDLRPGEDLFLTFRADQGTVYLNPNRSTTTAWMVPESDHSGLRNWEGLSVPETRGYLYAVSEIRIVERPTDDADGNGLPDDWEREHFGTDGVDPDTPAGAAGLRPVEAFILGEHPETGGPLRLIAAADGGLRFSTRSAAEAWYGGRERAYILQRAESLLDTGEDAWTDTGSTVEGTGTEAVLPPPEEAGFHRLRVELR